MLSHARLTAFIATAKAAQAKSFYAKTLGLAFVYEDDFAVVFDSNGVELRLQKIERLRPQQFTSLGWQITGLDDVIRALVLRGVRFERFAGMEQDSLGIWSAPSGARIAWFKDPDGNLLSMSEYAV